jgi:hypothetical protein
MRPISDSPPEQRSAVGKYRGTTFGLERGLFEGEVTFRVEGIWGEWDGVSGTNLLQGRMGSGKNGSRSVTGYPLTRGMNTVGDALPSPSN